MVKRKADISLDEWLERGTIIPATTHAEVAADTTRPASANCPTAEAVPQTVPVTATGVDPTDRGEGAEEWF